MFTAKVLKKRIKINLEFEMFIYEIVHKIEIKKNCQKNKMSAQKKTKKILKKISTGDYYSASHKINDQREETL